MCNLVFKSKRMGCSGHAVWKNLRNSRRILVRKPERKIRFGKQNEDIKIDVSETVQKEGCT